MSTVRTSFAPIAAAIALTIAGPALAAPTDAAMTATVELHDLDLSSPAGQERLERRIEAAARSVCASGLRGLAARRAEDGCIAAALLDAGPRAQRAIALARGGQRMAGTGVTVGG